MDWSSRSSSGGNSRNYSSFSRRGQAGRQRGYFGAHSSDRFSNYEDVSEGYHTGNHWKRGGRGGKFSHSNRRERFNLDDSDMLESLDVPHQGRNRRHAPGLRGRFDSDASDIRQRLQRQPQDQNRKRPPPGLRGKEIGLWYARHSEGAIKKAAKKAPVLSMNASEAFNLNKRIDDLSLPGVSSNASFDAFGVKRKIGKQDLFQDGESIFKGLRYGKNSREEKEKPANKAPISSMNTSGTSDLIERIENISSPGMPSNASFDAPIISRNLEKDAFAEEEAYCFNNFDKPKEFTEHNRNLFSSGGSFERFENSKFSNAYKANIEGNKLSDMGLNHPKKVSTKEWERNREMDRTYFEELEKKENDSRYQEMLNFRKRLPCYEKREEILKLIRENQVVVLSGETGCGKTTQIAQFILDDVIRSQNGSMCHIICTQPRRISAITVAERVAQERAEELGRSVGYQIRLESVLPRNEGSILFCTTGIVLQWLQSDPLLSTVSHLILDEIHERDSLSDFLICISRDLINIRPDLKVVLMSATLNAEKFSKYFNNCSMIHIPGFTYDVQEYYLEDVLQITGFRFPAHNAKRFHLRRDEKDKKEAAEFEDYILPYVRDLQKTNSYPMSVTNELGKRCSELMNPDLITSLVKHIAKQPPGAILIFLPGWEQISKLDKMLRSEPFIENGKYLIIPLHSMMPTVNQKQVFNRPPPGVRKIIIATNIAETSITIDDIVYVIDSGYIKMKNFDKKSNISTLLPAFVTLANSKQRRGRAGRVQEGICYHLFSRGREKILNEFPLPEIQRTRLEEVILQIKILQLGSCKSFLTKILDPPEKDVIDVSIKMLEAINALDKEENLTPLGFHLARLPMDPLTGKMILMGSIFSCLSPILTIAASLSFKEPFVIPMGRQKEVDECRLRYSRGTKSDHLMMVNVFDEWQSEGGVKAYRFMRDNYLSNSILTQLKNIRIQFMNHLRNSQFTDTSDPEHPDVNRNSSNIAVVKAIITAGLYPNVARILKKNSGKNKGQLARILLPDMTKGVIHPKSVNENEKNYSHSWFVFWEKIKTSKVFLYDTTEISNYPLLLFGQKLIYDSDTSVINVDEFVKIQCDENIANVIKKLRRELDELLEHKISYPGPSMWSDSSKEGRLLSLIVDLISNEKATQEHTMYDNDEDF